MGDKLKPMNVGWQQIITQKKFVSELHYKSNKE